MATILLVDDHDSQRELYELALRHAGFVVHEAEDGEHAIESVRRAKPDVIVLDLAMPKLDGLEVCRRLKADPQTPAIPIIAVTAPIFSGQDDPRKSRSTCRIQTCLPPGPRGGKHGAKSVAMVTSGLRVPRAQSMCRVGLHCWSI